MVFLGASLMFVAHSAAQQLSGPGRASFDPCPGGSVNAQIDSESPPSLEKMVQASELIIVGRVANVLPAVLNNPYFLYVTETPSLIAIREVLHGTLPPKTNVILLNQLGGEVGRCKMVVDRLHGR